MAITPSKPVATPDLRNRAGAGTSPAHGDPLHRPDWHLEVPAPCSSVTMKRMAIVAGSVLAAAGCPGHSDRPAPRPTAPTAALTTVRIDNVPFVQQEPDFCGEACVEMASRRNGKSYDQDAVFAATGVDPALGRGAWTRDLVRAVQDLGYKPGAVWTSVDAGDPQPGIDTAFAALHADLVRGVPSIVCMHYDDRPDTTEHFRLVLGYDADRDEVIYHEPAEKNGA